MADVFVRGVPKGAGYEEVKDTVKKIFLKVSGNLEWLSKGDLVLLKPALNSCDPFPATTHPASVHGVYELLTEKGAEVVIGDMSGIEDVAQDENGIIRGSSSSFFRNSGIDPEGKLPFTAFETTGWDTGFRLFRPEGAESWPGGFFATGLIDEADHIVSLPRLSTHAMAGVTLGFKNMVGLLRDDSRVEFHSEGPLYGFIKKAAKGSALNTEFGRNDTFFQKITGISLATRDNLRATLFTGTKAQLTFGPNSVSVRTKGGGFGRAYVHEPDIGLVFASTDQVAAEVFALAYMAVQYRSVPFAKKIPWKAALAINGRAFDPGRRPPKENPFVSHAVSLHLGEAVVNPVYRNVPDDLVNEINGEIGR